MRYQYLDILRGLCILLMILFHLNYSLVNIFNINFLNFSDIFWYIVGRVSALGFMMISGVSFYLASTKYSAAKLQNKYLKYSGVLAVIAIAITLTTYVFTREQLILFGILHLFAVSFFLLPFIVRWKYGPAIALAGIALISWICDTQVSNAFMFPLGFYNSDFRSADYYPLIPYLGYILGGYILGGVANNYNSLKLLQTNRDLLTLEKILAYFGKRSLVIYILHQPIIIGTVWILKTTFN